MTGEPGGAGVRASTGGAASCVEPGTLDAGPWWRTGVRGARAAAGELARYPGRTAAGVILFLVVLWALAPSLFAGYEPTLAVPAQRLQGAFVVSPVRH